MYHKPTPEVKAGAIAEVMAGVTVRVILEIALGVDDQGPLVGLNLEGGLPSRNQRLSQTPKGVKRITDWSLPFWTLKHG